MDRVMIFVDNSNLFYRIGMYERDMGQVGFRLDYEKLRDKLAEGYRLMRVYLYMPRPEPEHYLTDQRFRGDASFFSKAHYFAMFTVVEFKRRWRCVGEWKCQHCCRLQEKAICPSCMPQEIWIPREKGLDVGLATDMLRFAARGDYDVGILVSGDSDYVRTIEAIAELHRGQRIFNADFGRYKNTDLIRACSGQFIDLGGMLNDIRLKR